MGLTPGQGAGAVREHPAAVAQGQSSALGWGHDPAGAAHIQGLAGGPAQERGQPGQRGLEPPGQPQVAAGVAVAVRVVVAGGPRRALAAGSVLAGLAG
jgi:hypothetical protein